MFRYCLLLSMSLGIHAAEVVDPTRPSGHQAPQAAGSGALVLHSVLISGQRRVAVINDQAVSVGDRVSGAQVVAISGDQVRLKRAGQSLTLELARPKIRQDQ